MAQGNLEPTNPLLFNDVDPAPEIDAYNRMDIPFTWLDKLQASASNSLPKQFNSNVTAFQEYVAEGIDYIARNPEQIEKFLPFAPEAPSGMKEAFENQNVIKQPEELNKLYNTNAFKLPMASYLAEGYLQNFQDREANNYVMAQDGGTNLAIQLAGGTAGFIEPSNLVPNLLMAPVMKGASLAKVVASMGTEAAASSIIAAEGRRVGSGEEFSASQIALETTLGTALGTGAHYIAGAIGKRLERPTAKSAAETANALDGIKSGPESRMQKLLTQAPEELRNKVINSIDSLMNTDAKLSTDSVIDNFLPTIKAEKVQSLEVELNNLKPDYDPDGTQSFVFNEKTEILTDLGDEAKVYSSSVQDAAKTSIMDGSPEIHAYTVPETALLNLDSMTIATATPKAIETLSPFLKGIKDPSTKISGVVKLLEPKQRARFIADLSKENDGKAIIYDGNIHDFGGKVSSSPVLTAPLKSTELDPPKADKSFLKGVDKEERYGSPLDAQTAQGFVDMPSVDMNPKVMDLQSRVDEVLNEIKDKVQSGFIDDDMLKSFEGIKSADAKFQIQEDVARAFIFCTRGNS